MNANNQIHGCYKSWETVLYIILHVLCIGIPMFYMCDMGVLHTYITVIHIVFYIEG